MIPKQLNSFIYRVLEETEEGALNWYEGFDDTYICESKLITLHLSNGYDDSRDVYYYAFRIVKGTQVTPFSVGSHEEDYYFMKRLYEAVVFNANDISNDLSSFFD